jgi:hypothetical protein
MITAFTGTASVVNEAIGHIPAPAVGCHSIFHTYHFLQMWRFRVLWIIPIIHTYITQ